ncbi:hypothetical protein BZA70DRAFT_299201 [Myxozyma melibiosi]|uniref:Ketoreductase domain-containing protein n=1 Tax=Myxozyma melibiosi TaxID=54550 RepID=A0ABR1F8A0_9ASCO
MLSDFSFTGKSALITGGSRGLGLSAAKGLMEAGASTVFITSRSEKACAEAVEFLNGLSGIKGKAIAVPGDFSKAEDIYRVKKVVQQTTDRLNVVVANAGATWGAPFDTHPEKAFDRVLGLNVKGVFFTIQAFADMLEKAGTSEDPARAIVLGSVTGLMVSSNGGGGTYGYTASKAAVHHLAEVLAVELGPRNICVNALAPGFFRSKMANGLIDMIGDENLSEINPRGRLGFAEDIENMIVFLSGKASCYLNGAIIPLDGGLHLVSKL